MGRFGFGELQNLEKRWVFDSIVESDEDVVGLIGYALYKYKKHTLAKSLRAQNRGEEDIKREVQIFHDQFLHNNSVEEYRNKATDYLDQLFSKVESEEREKYEKEKEKLEKQLKRDLRKGRNDFIKSVQEYEKMNKPWHARLVAFLISGVPGIVSSFLITSLVVGAALVLVPEEKRKEVFTTLAAEYIGIDLPQSTNSK